MKNIIAAVLCALMLVVSPASAGGTKPAPSTSANTPYARIYRATDAASVPSSATTIGFDTASYDPKSICNLTTAICTPGVAGLYQVTCQAKVVVGTTPAAGNNALVEVGAYKGSTLVADNYITSQVSGITNLNAFAVSSSTMQLNATDTVSCKINSDGTSVTMKGGTTLTFLTITRIGAQ